VVPNVIHFALEMGWMAAGSQKSKSILLVDDDTRLCALMRDFFSHYGYEIEGVHDGGRGLSRALETDFDLVILDVMLPVIDGFEVLRQLRKRSAVPVIMLTARTEQDDRIAGLNAGADDYLPKPFGPEELLARMRAIWRRSDRAGHADPESWVAGPLRIELETRTVWANGQPLPLTSVEFDMLELLVRSAGRVVSRDELAASVLQREFTPYDRSVDVHISHLRKKLEDMAAIQTVRGVGYLFVPGASMPDVGR
jgi:two-component system, OmpR family, response regulator CpxR